VRWPDRQSLFPTLIRQGRRTCYSSQLAIEVVHEHFSQEERTSLQFNARNRVNIVFNNLTRCAVAEHADSFASSDAKLGLERPAKELTRRSVEGDAPEHDTRPTSYPRYVVTDNSSPGYTRPPRSDFRDVIPNTLA
jgi:hypothetical protein